MQDYLTEANTQLSNSTHYVRLNNDPTSKIAKASNKLADNLLQKGYISETTHRWAVVEPNKVLCHRFYLLPKIHKSTTNPPGRPIVSGTHGPTENLSKLVDDWLQIYVTHLPSYVKDSTHMLQILSQWNLEFGPFDRNTRLVTIDVKALYTNIPHSELETALKHFLNKHQLPNTPPVETVLQITNHVLSNNVFCFEDKYYKQVMGTAMGTPMAPSAACLFMGWLEDNLLTTSPVPVSSSYWKRYIDDIFLLWTRSLAELQQFSEFLNQFHPSVKFTVTFHDRAAPFLDILVSLENGFLQSDLYSKPTDVHGYLHGRSSHPRHVIQNLPYSLFLRLRRLCSKTELFHQRSDALEKQLRARGHHPSVITKARTKASTKSRQECLQYIPKQRNQRVPLVVTHNPSNPPLRTWIRELHQSMIETSQHMAQVAPDPPILGERNSRSLRALLMPSMIPTPTDVNPGSYKCQSSCCVVCQNHLVEGQTFQSQKTKEIFHIRHKLTCTTFNLIYTCSHSHVPCGEVGLLCPRSIEISLGVFSSLKYKNTPLE